MVSEPVRGERRRVSSTAPLPATMRAVLLTGYGGFDKLALRSDVPVPQPGPGDVLIRVTAAGINNTDIYTRIGWYAKSVTDGTDVAATAEAPSKDGAGWSGTCFSFPRIQGADACGTIVAVGAGVDPVRVGERVLVEPVFRQKGPFDILYFGSKWTAALQNLPAFPRRTRIAWRQHSRMLSWPACPAPIPRLKIC